MLARHVTRGNRNTRANIEVHRQRYSRLPVKNKRNAQTSSAIAGVRPKARCNCKPTQPAPRVMHPDDRTHAGDSSHKPSALPPKHRYLASPLKGYRSIPWIISHSQTIVPSCTEFMNLFVVLSSHGRQQNRPSRPRVVVVIPPIHSSKVPAQHTSRVLLLTRRDALRLLVAGLSTGLSSGLLGCSSSKLLFKTCDSGSLSVRLRLRLTGW